MYLGKNQISNVCAVHKCGSTTSDRMGIVHSSKKNNTFGNYNVKECQTN